MHGGRNIVSGCRLDCQNSIGILHKEETAQFEKNFMGRVTDG